MSGVIETEQLKFVVRKDIANRLRAMALREHRTLSNQIRHLVESAVEGWEGGDGE